jgi:hypothetical protein
MFLGKHISPNQKHGIVISLPKNSNPRTINDYRPITLLTTECKLLAKVLAQRLRRVVADKLQGTQYCGIPGNTIMDALATVRDVIAHAVVAGKSLCILTLDFEHAFDRISHRYLFRVVRQYGISTWFTERLQAMYEQAEASVQVNGALVWDHTDRVWRATGVPNERDSLRHVPVAFSQNPGRTATGNKDREPKMPQPRCCLCGRCHRCRHPS